MKTPVRHISQATATATTTSLKLAVATVFLGAAALAAAAMSGNGTYQFKRYYTIAAPTSTPPVITKFTVELSGKNKPVSVTNSLAQGNLPVLSTSSFGNTFEVNLSDRAILTILAKNATVNAKYGFAVQYQAFTDPQNDAAFATDVVPQIVWAKPAKKYSLYLTPDKIKNGFVTVHAFVYDHNQKAFSPKALGADATYIILKAAPTSTLPVGATSTPAFTTSTAAVQIMPAFDATTVSGIRLPSETPIQLGKWKITTGNSPLNLKKIMFQTVGPNAVPVNDATEFGALTLYDAADMTTPLATGNYVNGYATFQKSYIWSIPANTTRYLVLRGKVTDSGIMKPAAIRAWSMRVTAPSSLELMMSNSGQMVSNEQITTDTGLAPNGVKSTYYLFHNAAPVIASLPLPALTVSSQAPIFKFSVTNPGTRPIRLATTTIDVAVSGLTSGSSGTGTINNFKLFESTNNIMIGLAKSAMSANAWSGPLSLVFGAGNQLNGGFTNLMIDPGATRTFTLTADTTNMLISKSNGFVGVSASLKGQTGYKAGDNVAEAYWGNGAINYFYMPLAGSENVTAYSASDSYDVYGPALHN